jgi:hypothetical protein
MRVALLTTVVLLGISSTLSAHGHRRVAPLVGYGPVNPFGHTMTNELYTTALAPTFRGTGAIPEVPINSTGPQKAAVPRQGSKPSIIMQTPPPVIPNPQLTPPVTPPPGSTSAVPPPPTPASVKPSSQPATGPRRP